jgi:hypothetical protein
MILYVRTDYGAASQGKRGTRPRSTTTSVLPKITDQMGMSGSESAEDAWGWDENQQDG